jgi:hypothetical protein
MILSPFAALVAERLQPKAGASCRILNIGHQIETWNFLFDRKFENL